MPINLSPKAYEAAEGEWNGLRIRRVEPKDYEAVLYHVARYFVRDEPTCKLLGYSEELASDFLSLVKPMLPHNLSFLAEDLNTGEIVGVRISFHHDKNTSFDSKFSTLQGRLLEKLIEQVEAMADPVNTLGVDEYAEFFVASTSPKYRQKGLAGELYKRSLKFFKDVGYKFALVIVSSPFTRAATERQGFKELARLHYKDFKGFDGNMVFSPDELTSEHMACVRVKEL